MKLMNDLYKIASSVCIDGLPSFNIVLNKEHFIYKTKNPDNKSAIFKSITKKYSFFISSLVKSKFVSPKCVAK